MWSYEWKVDMHVPNYLVVVVSDIFSLNSIIIIIIISKPSLHHLKSKNVIVANSLQVGDVVFSKDVFLIWPDTPLKTNIEPKNEGLEDDFPLHLGDVFRFHLSFPGCTGIVYGWLKRCSIKYWYFLLSDVQETDTFPRCSIQSLHTFENDWSLCSSMFYFMTLWSTTLHCHVPLEAEYGSTSL